MILDALQMKSALMALNEEFPGNGFIILNFPFGDVSGMANYVSNANREDCIKFLRETADRLEKRKDFPTPTNN